MEATPADRTAMETRAAELEHFSRAIAHDLQEPLRKIANYAGLLKEDLGGAMSPEAEEDLRVITEAAARMSRLVQDVVEYARLGSADLELASVRLDDCLDDALEQLADLAAEGGLAVRRVPLPVVRGDRGLLTLVFRKLLDNAYRYARGSTEDIRITAEDLGVERAFGVEDAGPGIPLEFYGEVFLPLRRLAGAKQHPGTGFGLAMARRVVERHGGRTWVEAGRNGGAHFRFTLGEGPAGVRP